MFPHQLVGVAIRRVRREKEQHQLSAQRFDKSLGLLGAMCGPAIDDQEDLALRSDQKSLQKFDDIRIHAAGFFDHKTHMTFGSYRRDQTDAVPGSCRLDDRRFTLLSPRAPRVMIRTHVRRVSKINVRTLHLRHFLYLRIFSLQPSLHERLIAFESAMQRFLTGDTQLRQQPSHGHHAQDNLESGLDDLCHHLARPQRKFKFELQRILLRHRFVYPFQFLVVQLWWTTKKRLRLQGAPAALAIIRQPPKHRTIGYAQRPRDNRRSLARLDGANRPFPQSFQRLVIQPARVVFSHAATEPEPINLVKENVQLLMFRLIYADHDAGLITKEGAAVFPRAELVVHENELKFWRDESNIARLSEDQKSDFALATIVLAAYADRLRPIRAGDVASGISAVPTPGHTPGHTARRISSGSEQLLIWGDMIHLPGVQFAIPEASVIYDLDSHAAATARRRVLDMVSTDRVPVVGVHLDFPGYGRVTAGANGRYIYTAELWTPVIRR